MLEMEPGRQQQLQYVGVDLGVETADAERVTLRFEADLHVSFVDWREQPRELVFQGVLAFRWQEFDEPDIRDDTTYEVIGSPWLARQATLQGEDPSDYAHYVLGFNARCVIDVLARRMHN